MFILNELKLEKIIAYLVNTHFIQVKGLKLSSMHNHGDKVT